MLKIKKSFLVASLLTIGMATYSYAGAETQQPTSVVTTDKQQAEAQILLNEQLKMLERSIVPTTPEGTVDLWAKAVKMRNGALQYALFTDTSKLGLKPSLESFHWVTGASSPWVEGYTLKHLEESKNSLVKRYLVDFELATSTGKFGADQAVLTVVKQGDQWYIQGLAPASEKSVGIWSTANAINEQNFEEMGVYHNPLGYKIVLSKKDMDLLKIELGTCSNEEGNPPCIHFYYKDEQAKKNVLLASVIHLSKAQEELPYYKDHPFIHKLGEHNSGSFYSIYPSEHPYAGQEDSEQGKEWSRLLEELKGQIGKSIQ